ncbi:transcription factor [Pseudogymnoascus verrucosus]|uniref:Transcription factor n=1 Tax=Pseudogymnoascus verrucosus TaxID=342668 RepID=A0A1B8GVL4_9PEZI|nr:transcription factor [Pseudogymnoascus verrucosus]OBT99874.1 transcription factor [Pseudogymnoascus verrucosus]
MPPSTKRTQRAKRGQPINHSDDMDTTLTSPAQSAKRRRTKAEMNKSETRAPEPVKLPTSQAELNMSDEDLVSTVSQHLSMPDHFVQVARDHDNHHHQRQSKNVAAYAKVTGKDWTFYVKRLRTNIGRPPEGYIAPLQDENAPTTPAVSNEGDGMELPAAPTEPSRIHIDIGPNKLVSRLHAEIYFDSQTSQWNVIVNGRNGIKVNDQQVRRGHVMKLQSGAVIEVAGVEMMFVLPTDDQPVEIDDKYLQRAGLIASDPFQSELPITGNFLAAANRGKAEGTLGSNHPTLAPAPPDYKKPDTPAKQRARGPIPTSSPAFGRAGGTIIMSADTIDYQNDATSHIKPAFTYGQLISQALYTSENEMATLNDIYEYMKRNYAHYRRPEFFKGWQNSIRHNLSLNPGFKVRQRGPEDTGKGGYWCFTPDMREHMISDAWGPKSARKSPPKRRETSGTPRSSPGPKITRTVHGPGDKEGGSPSRRVKRSPGGSPTMRGIPPNGSQQTPDRLKLPRPLLDEEPGDGSPLPRRRTGSNNPFGIGENAAESPVLSSSFAQEEGTAFLTPAPVRKHPHFAPPSTAQRPSQHMPTSSPAPFWRFAELGNTPSVIKGAQGGLGFDVSPLRGLGGDAPQSSSPAPRRRRESPERSADVKDDREDEESEGEEPAFDLTRGFMKISKYHASAGNGAPIASASKVQP